MAIDRVVGSWPSSMLVLLLLFDGPFVYRVLVVSMSDLSIFTCAMVDAGS